MRLDYGRPNQREEKNELPQHGHAARNSTTILTTGVRAACFFAASSERSVFVSMLFAHIEKTQLVIDRKLLVFYQFILV